MAGDAASDGDGYIRLHITPLTPALLPTFLPPSILPAARNISYHTLQTFPERAYGFLELPSMEASKIQKKLNGSILKGTKIRIETARPEKLPVPEQPEPEVPKADWSKKRKRDETIPAAEIGERSVKRGWTVPSSKGDKRGDKKEKEKDKKAKSKYTSGKECLFKTVVPPNKMDLKEGKSKRKRNAREEIVHEFEKTTRHASFLRGSKLDDKVKTASQFIEGKGWVDDDGNLIEEVITKRKSENTAPAVNEDVTLKDVSSEDDSSDEAEPVESEEISKPADESASDTSEDDSSEASSSEAESNSAKADIGPADEGSLSSSSGSLSGEESDSSSDPSDSEPEPVDESLGKEPETPSQPINSGPRKLNSRPASSAGLKITIPTDTTPISNPNSVHPLEALYKRPAATASSQTEAGSKPPVPTFSFFGADQDGEVDESEARDQMPLTPFTQRDFEFRGQRSAAPTPDTAHPNKRFMWPADNETDEEEDDEEENATPSGKDKAKAAAAGEKNGGEGAESEFQKWFYEHRGDTNRAWKKRRKVVAKEARQRENRKRGDKAA